MLIAHAKWFLLDHGRHGPDWAFLLSAWTLAPAAGLAAAVALLRCRAAFERPRPSQRRQALAAHLPRALGVAVGVTLLALAVQHRLLLPNLRLPPGAAGAALASAQLVTGAWLISGMRLDLAGLALIGLVATGAIIAEPLVLVETAYYPGAGIYLVLTRHASLGRAPAEAPWRALAVALGGSLIVVAFTEKLAVPSVSLEVLDAHPALNPLSTVGIALPPGTFVRLVGLGELLVGLLIATGVGGRLTPLALIGPFVATVAIFGLPEFLGHLPIYAALVAVAARTDPQRALSEHDGRISSRTAYSSTCPLPDSEKACSCSASRSCSSSFSL